MPDNRPDNKLPRNKSPLPPARFGKSLMWWVVFAIVAVVLMSVLMDNYRRPVELTPGEFWNYARNGQIKELVIKSEQVEGELVAGIPGRDRNARRRFYMPVNFDADRTFGERLEKVLQGKKTRWRYEKAPGWFSRALPYIVLYGGLFLLMWFFLFRRIGQAGGGAGFLGQFGRSRHRLISKERTNITFRDVAGIDEAKEEVGEIIEFLKNPQKFSRLGARIPRGVLLHGEPGCGKTLLAKAIAGEADVPFFSISGSDFVEMFVGVGASRVRDLFRQAKEAAPCIIFLDEIDAVGRRRGAAGLNGGHDEREQTLNAILVEMDGFDTSDQVIVIAATNRMDVLDPALTRPGRFDRQIHVPLPDIKGRLEILRIYAGKVSCCPDVDLEVLARGTPMFSGADLAALINEAAIAATMSNKQCIEQSDLEEARDKVRWGRARKSRAIDMREKEMTAYHEAGHALVQMLLPEADPLHKVSIIPRGHMGGGTFSLPEKDRYLYTRRWCEAFIRVAVAGRIAEEIFCGDIDSGAAADIAQATDLARRMVMDWGMSEKLGFVRYTPNPQQSPFIELGGKEYSEKTAEMIDEEIKRIMDAADADARKILMSNQDKVKRLAEALLAYETLSADEVRKIIEGQEVRKTSMNELLRKEASQSAGATVASPNPSAKPSTKPPSDAGTIPEPG